MKTDEQFWKVRSKAYNKLKWVNDKKYMDAFIKAAEPNKTYKVLDVGTGTGIVAHTIAPFVKEVIGLDVSQAMLDNCNWKGNLYFVKEDIRNKLFNEGTFDLITARMVFHHILKNIGAAMNECYRVLKNGGTFIISEGIPPHPDIRDDYEKIFKLKENRNVFLEKDLIDMMKLSGFTDIKSKEHIMRNFSVRNWLENSGLSYKKQDKIFEMHVTASPKFKKAYNLKIINGDCLIDVKNIIITGRK